MRKAAKKAGAIVSTKNAKAGDLVIVYVTVNGKKTPHMVICEKIENGKLYTIQSSGKGKVSNKTYDISSIQTIMRVTK